MSRSVAILVLLALSRTHAGGDHGGGGHDHCGVYSGLKFPFEWAGAFASQTVPSTIIFQPTAIATGSSVKAYKENYILMSMHPVGAALDTTAATDKTALAALLEGAEPGALALWNVTSPTMTPLADGGTVAMNTLYNLTFSGAFTTLTVPAQATPYALYFEHVPLEFEDYTHWIKHGVGEDTEPVVTETFNQPKKCTDEHTGEAMLASIIVALISFTGVVFASGSIVRMVGDIGAFRGHSCAFASGALLYCALAIMWPEAMEKLNSAGLTHAMANANFATCTAAGVALCILLDMASPALLKKQHPSSNVAPVAAEGQVAVADAKQATDVGAPAAPAKAADIDWVRPKSFCDFSAMETVSIQVIFGDFFHNIVDGVLIGSAFKACGASMGWTVTAGTIYHEIAQEVADFLVLVTKGGLSFWQAVFGNFISATGCIIGCAAVVSNNPTNEALGCLLGFGGGVYVHIALGELNWWTENSSMKVMMQRSFLFFLGCLGIGLVLLSHEHCESGAAGAAHAHGH